MKYPIIPNRQRPDRSLPAWECGLKSSTFTITDGRHCVTPCVGVWIEIPSLIASHRNSSSLPAWECGLKLPTADIHNRPRLSLPAWECGLKLPTADIHNRPRWSLPAWECGLKYPFLSILYLPGRHSLRGSVD